LSGPAGARSDFSDNLHSTTCIDSALLIIVRRMFRTLFVIVAVLLSSIGQAERPPVRSRGFHFNGNPPPAQVRLGQRLFFDKILSGNKNISCATCHHPTTGTSDQLSLGVGEGGRGLGLRRTTGRGASKIVQRVPRNSPALFNLGAREFRTLFWDGRLSVNHRLPHGFDTPAGDKLPRGLRTPLAAQAMFPVTSPDEMAGQEHENPVGAAAKVERWAGENGIWQLLANRLREIPEYVQLFQRAFPAEVRSANDITFVQAANAIAAFETKAFRADGSPFDRYLAGDLAALNPSAQRGRELFYGRARCLVCHSGRLQTDHQFHVVAMPQVGPGKGDGWRSREDFGREKVTSRRRDRYRFKTPSLRNVMLTAPWGHAGAFSKIEDVILHHVQPDRALSKYDDAQLRLPSRSDLDRIDRMTFFSPTLRHRAFRRNELPRGVELSDRDVQDLVSFLHALTDPRSTRLGHWVPATVPSGLPVAD
jgi:cytochrome c peroxidase